MVARYGMKAQKKVRRAMHEMKRGKLKSGRSGSLVKSRKQAIAIGLSQARKEGGKVPPAKEKHSEGEKKKDTGMNPGYAEPMPMPEEKEPEGMESAVMHEYHISNWIPDNFNYEIN